MTRFFCPPFLLLLAPAVVRAQDPAAPETAAKQAEASPTGFQLNTILEHGGVTLWVLLGMSIIMVSLIVFYLLTIRRGAVVSDQFMKTAESLIRKQDYLGLLAVCNRRGESIAKITHKTLDFATKNPTATFDEVREVTQAEGQRQSSLFTQRIRYLADVGEIAPLVGLLGTVFGIIAQFGQISKESMLSAQLRFAGGVAEALTNTAAGLVIAIPSLAFYSIFRGRVNSMISELEDASSHIMALLAAQYKRVTAPRPAPSPVRKSTTSA